MNVLSDCMNKYSPTSNDDDTGNYIEKGGIHPVLRYVLTCNPINYNLQDCFYMNPVITPLFVEKNKEISKYYMDTHSILVNPQFNYNTLEKIINYIIDQILYTKFQITSSDYHQKLTTIEQNEFNIQIAKKWITWLFLDQHIDYIEIKIYLGNW